MGYRWLVAAAVVVMGCSGAAGGVESGDAATTVAVDPLPDSGARDTCCALDGDGGMACCDDLSGVTVIRFTSPAGDVSECGSYAGRGPVTLAPGSICAVLNGAWVMGSVVQRY